MIDWIDRQQRVPDDRREVLVCCQLFAGLSPRVGRRCVRLSRCNLTANGEAMFDIERGNWLTAAVVTHWAEADMPRDAGPPQLFTLPPGTTMTASDHWRPPRPLPPTPRPAAVDTLDEIDGTG